MNRKQFDFKVKEVTAEGLLTGYASVFGVLDSDSEVVDKGAFKRTLDHKKGVVPVLWQHDRTRPVGWGQSAEEDSHGLAVKFQLLLDTEAGRYAFEFAKKGMELGGKVGLSIGFRVPANGSYVKDNVRHFREVELLEYSVVTFPANVEAAITGVKRGALPQKGKAMDFNSALAAQAVEQELYKERWNIESALDDAMEACMEDDTMALQEKQSAAADNISQYAVALTDWWQRKLAAEATEEPAAKAGRAISAATAKSLAQALDHITASDMNAKMAAACRTKAKKVLNQILGSEQAVTDVNNPNPAGKSDEDELAELAAITAEFAKAIR